MADRDRVGPTVDRGPAFAGARSPVWLRRGARFVMLVGTDERAVGRRRPGRRGRALGGPTALARVRATLPLGGRRPTRRSRRWCRRRTGTSARRGTCSGSSPVGHPDPRRLVLHERWPRGYHPLRKDVPRGRRGRPSADRRFVPFEVARRGRLPAARGPHPRRHHRARPLPVLRDRRARAAPRRAPVLHPSRPGEARRGALASRRPLPLVERACGVCTVTHALAYAQAVER